MFRLKTGYEVRISDWSSAVFSSDLSRRLPLHQPPGGLRLGSHRRRVRVAAEHLPADLHGHAADLGAGGGYLSVELLQRCPGITALDLFEARTEECRVGKECVGSYKFCGSPVL